MPGSPERLVAAHQACLEKQGFEESVSATLAAPRQSSPEFGTSSSSSGSLSLGDISPDTFDIDGFDTVDTFDASVPAGAPRDESQEQISSDSQSDWYSSTYPQHRASQDVIEDVPSSQEMRVQQEAAAIEQWAYRIPDFPQPLPQQYMVRNTRLGILVPKDVQKMYNR